MDALLDFGTRFLAQLQSPTLAFLLGGIVIAALGAGLADGASLGALAAAYVLITAIAGPVATKFSSNLRVPNLRRKPAVAT